MSAVGFCGPWVILTCDKKLCAAHRKEADREPFVFDCSTAEKKPKNRKDESSSDGGPSEETGSDKVLAFAVSPSGKLLALTDDTKRLVLFSCEPSWHCVSIRWVVRRCTSLVFTQAEDELLVADKSGDVYSFSVAEPQKEGELKMGHLSLLLAVTTSLDDKYIITADRDEKIRVSHLRSPHSIQSFCLGHCQFVSALQIPSGHPHWLLSGSGNPTVCRISSSTDGQLVAVQCERVSTVQVFTLAQEEKLVPHSRISLPHCPLDVNFDLEGRLWVLMDSSDAPLQIYSLTQGCWEVAAHDPDLSRVTEAFRPHWEPLEASMRTNNRFEQLHKVSFDNVAVYLQKKQQRLEEQQLKRSAAQTANGNKKAKKEAD
ncbi:tRNA (guanine-N(7)-)-methyltransferase non-catalytic subunit wdr4 isoform X2 [Archocentrus centrarchus]|uniref:tRNA (guanine-N(7)-)-methyltransferase non-catalytic subunit wdr4 isoform X2 n=1 Tax=Archocentrus centrarchus TaxID=63155 RepID=UPI0011EA1A1A|nr:tRNA (guanine-N(7)-)-methyltransferase non-catalytic subunit WDR4 isoform X2 [Archocentrus centrarchus]